MSMQIIIFLIVSIFNSCHASLFPELGKKTATVKFFPTIIEERQERLLARKKEKAEFQAKEKEILSAINDQLEALKQEINFYEQQLKINPENELIKQKLELALEYSASLTDMKYAHAQILVLLEDLNKFDQEYLADPEFKKNIKPYLDKTSYSFDEDLIPLYEKILGLEKELDLLIEQENTAAAELQNKKRSAQSSLQAYQKKELEQLSGRLPDNVLSPAQKAELQTLKEKVLAQRKEADALKVKEAEYKYMLLQTKQFNIKRHLEELKTILRTIKSQIKITEGELAFAFDEIDKKKLTSRAQQENYRQEIEVINTTLKGKERELDVLSRRYNIPLDTDLNDWTKEAKNTGRSHLLQVQVATLNEEVQLLRYQRMLLEAQLLLEEQKLRDEILRAEVKETFYKIINGQLSSDERLTNELKKYQIQKNEIKTALSLLQERQTSIASLITSEKKSLANIVDKIANAEKKRFLFRDATIDFEQYVALLKTCQEKTQEQIDILNKITGVNTEILSKINHIGKYLDFAIGELASITPWGRPEHAISWEGIKNSVPDVASFFKDIKNYFKMIRIQSLVVQLLSQAT